MPKIVWRQIIVLALVAFVFNAYMIYRAPVEVERVAAISYSLLKEEARRGNIQKITFQDKDIQGSFREPIALDDEKTAPDSAVVYPQFSANLPPFDDPELLELLQKGQAEIHVLPDKEASVWSSVLVYLIPWLLIIGFWWFIIKGLRNRTGGGVGGGLMGNFSKSGAKLYSQEHSRVTFDDVAGLDEAKQELMEVVEFLRTPKKFARLGGKVPRGVLLVGPPGTGKTLMARAVAGEAGVPFFSISASQFIEMFVGVGASRVRDLFSSAKKSAPSIIFIDELDAVGRSRGTGLGGGNDEREQTLNQLLAELDGFEPHEEVIVMSATNRPDVLDPALLRPGRFDRQVVVERPDWRARVAILKVHTRKVPLAEDVDLQVIARGTPGMCGADLESLINEAALIAARDDREQVSMAHLEKAKDKILMGAERKLFISEEEKKITAYHEAGHTLVAKLLPGTDPIHKVTIIPRGHALGVTQQLPEDDRYHYTRDYLMTRITVSLGGRSAEKAVFGVVSTGAQSDLKQVTELAEKMVCQWGMSDKIGPVTYSRGEEHPFLGRKLATEKTFSEQMAWLIDQEIEKIIKQGEKAADDIMEGHRPALDRLAAALLEEEVLERERVDDIMKLDDVK
ncbi:ATP-dependent zinc metalloprotease FtsH [Desulfuromonas sp. AOP6]|uniref:ATP-dependent zinc metalloprotease FtsH n=1 Tax=Desulfuromonas sp. AOP6 TaxID=1566351 RepID=UPI001280E43A|nr:ATP-dependent zinc metalloprotease FtsH [Desulfuromonas sp. AOP6]BCA80138.1 ATP-dependent zinc metalloprotease FtsH [Desulfuromonas sp. AOP6]